MHLANDRFAVDNAEFRLTGPGGLDRSYIVAPATEVDPPAFPPSARPMRVYEHGKLLETIDYGPNAALCAGGATAPPPGIPGVPPLPAVSQASHTRSTGGSPATGEPNASAAASPTDPVEPPSASPASPSTPTGPPQSPTTTLLATEKPHNSTGAAMALGGVAVLAGAAASALFMRRRRRLRAAAEPQPPQS